MKMLLRISVIYETVQHQYN